MRGRGRVDRRITVESETGEGDLPQPVPPRPPRHSVSSPLECLVIVLASSTLCASSFELCASSHAVLRSLPLCWHVLAALRSQPDPVDRRERCKQQRRRQQENRAVVSALLSTAASIVVARLAFCGARDNRSQRRPARSVRDEPFTRHTQSHNAAAG